MENPSNNLLLDKINNQYQSAPSDKTQKYINQFYGRIKKGNMIRANVEGNHGTYGVTLKLKNNYLASGCSCYIGKHGGCHHTTALAFTYKENPDSFEEQKIAKRSSVKDLRTLKTYLKDIPLEDLIDELSETKGITQAAFGRSIGMSSQHISAVKKSENRNRHFKELGAIKLACLYLLERKKIKS